MKQRVSRAEVAERARVSSTTVSLVLSGRTDLGISQTTWQRVLDAAADLGYTPNRVAQSLRTGQTRLIGLWMSVLGPAYYAGIVSQVQNMLRDRGFEMLTTDTAPHADRNDHINRLSQWPVDGVLVFDSPEYVREFRSHHAGRATPLVEMGVALDRSADYVEIDLEEGVRQALDYLTQSGRSEIAYLGDRYAMDDPRFLIYQQKMAEIGQELRIIEAPERSRRGGFMALSDQQALPEALFCFNDDLAIGAQRALLDRGCRIPQDVLVVGHDGLEDGDYLEPRLSTIAVPTRQMCELAWEMLQLRIATPDLPPQVQRLATSFLPRFNPLEVQS